eukprot:7376849-Prymnesium_polylepis.1
MGEAAACDALRARAPVQPVRRDRALAGNRVPALWPLDRVPRACLLRSRPHPPRSPGKVFYMLGSRSPKCRGVHVFRV